MGQGPSHTAGVPPAAEQENNQEMILSKCSNDKFKDSYFTQNTHQNFSTIIAKLTIFQLNHILFHLKHPLNLYHNLHLSSTEYLELSEPMSDSFSAASYSAGQICEYSDGSQSDNDINVASPIVQDTVVEFQSQPQLRLPVDKSQFATFVDHDCVINEQGYPIYPNGQTVYVKKPEDRVINFCHIAWSHTMRTEPSTNKKWIIRQYYCIGVMRCSNPDCELQAPPPTNPKKLAESVALPCTISGCDGIQVHFECHARCRIDQEVDEKDPNSDATWSLLRHQGIHHHPWPDSKKADPLSKDKLKDRIIQDPKTGPSSLKVGRAHTGTEPLAPVSEIHPSFAHIDHLGYLRRDILVTHGLMSDKNDPEGGNKWLLAIVHWARQGMRMVSVSLLPENTHMSLQTEWMAEVLVYQDKKKPEPYTGGLLSDVTYRFFESGYLLTTSMYNEKIERWVPVLQTWLHELSSSHYKSHFVALLQQIQKSSLSDEDKGLLCEQVVDFSQAQQVGFIDAYMEVFNIYDRNVALSKLHGCEQHFSQAITRIKKNTSIVKPHLQGLWVTLCKGLLLPDKPDKDLDARFEELRRLFPAAKKWITWWQLADTQAMLFPARKRMELDDPPLDGEEDNNLESRPKVKRGKNTKPRRRAELPATTNAQELMHCVYYMLCEGKCTMIAGMVQLLALAQSLEQDYRAERKGILIAYGSRNKGWEDVVVSLGMVRPTKRKYQPNNNRAPDTTEELLYDGKKTGTKRRKTKGPGRPKGSQNIIRHALTTYQSYTQGTTPGKLNCCWLSSTLECLYAMFGPLWGQFATVNGSNLFTVLMQHFTKRFKTELNKQSSLSKVLSQGQTLLHEAILDMDDWAKVAFKLDQPASVDGFMQRLMQDDTPKQPSLARLFSIPITKTVVCTHENAHVEKETTKSRNMLHITTSMFRDASIGYEDTALLTTRWATDGLFYSTGRVFCQCHPLDTDQPKDGDLATLVKCIKLNLTNAKVAPLHLYFHLDGVVELDAAERNKFMDQTDWPARFLIGEVDYHIVTRGYWASGHYWCKVARSVEGIMGVWLYDELRNGGFAQLIERNVTLLAGCDRHTSWISISMPSDKMPFGGGLPPLKGEIETGVEEEDADAPTSDCEDEENQVLQSDNAEQVKVKPPIMIKMKMPKLVTKDVTPAEKRKAAAEKRKTEQSEIVVKPSAKEKRQAAAVKRKAAAAEINTSLSKSNTGKKATARGRKAGAGKKANTG
ncbi:uncharacterized protein MELLADRAFT_87855 [Melampsora larici-populina 98AG31]|uniref:GCM domain-containing protein n=1 Tax=Melampsora larici-populina (strain 98AG31 / pathotype 3-4-7) TaxID=747676 RepID=F4RPR1_MELLP|nr:uncharacterized protein MELLADRAFT_87855 [Melampsora larici-populina 98AG31]EGG05587.1 hypothetical protein MELLADRAFT_87855 [Melampsora larici-populina 98AG31]